MPNVNGVTLELATKGNWSDFYATGYTSDEQGQDSQTAVCPAGYAMVGMKSTGNYSDNIASYCSRITNMPSGATPVVQRFDTPISEEGGGPWTHDLNNQWWIVWLNGASCTYSNCDNMFYWYTTIS